MSFTNKRTSRRVNLLNRHGMLFSKGKMIGTCDVLDISVGGARLVLSPGFELPEGFVLSLARLGRVYRKCKVVWRSETQAGVQFESESQ
jgi:hypothetical protein